MTSDARGIEMVFTVRSFAVVKNLTMVPVLMMEVNFGKRKAGLLSTLL